ncbi:AT hook domain-containing protein [Xylariales sp. AK1849]|nr:AT hook domain-containing protein [Xylariales sp. AK1849]
MATSRGERMQERMRGAGRHEVADESFGLFLPVEEAPEAPIPEAAPAPAPVSATRSTPNTSARRRRLDTETSSARPRPGSGSARSRSRTPVQPGSASKGDPYELEREDPQEEVPVVLSSPSRHEPVEDGDVEDTLEALPEAVQRPSSRSSVTSRHSIGPHTEEVTESPAEAPGSGHRRRVRISNVATQSAKLQKMVMDDDATVTGEAVVSSPLARKTRNGGATPSMLSARSTRTTGKSALGRAITADDDDELSPAVRPLRKSGSTATSGSARSSLSAARRSTLSTIADGLDELSSPVPLVESRRRAQAKLRPTKRVKETTPVIVDLENRVADAEADGVAEEDDEAEEIDANEAARHIGRKRPRASQPRQESPELDSNAIETSQPARKRRKKRAQDSPARQSQPKVQQSKKSESKPARRRQSRDDEHIPVTVQRYTMRRHYNEEDTDADILNSEIPFANRSGVNVVDVLAQMCDEVIDSNLATLHEAAANARVPAAKKEYRTKLRALEAFQEELRTQLLEHTIALDTMHALKKRVRSIQKEKLSLRSEIIRIRAEREQVALKMDAVRIRHETESRESLVRYVDAIVLGCSTVLTQRQGQLKLSSTMHDIDLAVENGRQAPELSSKEQKTADLANLELLISRVAGQATAGGDGNGNLKQIQEFNAFLERAAAALEAR